MATFLHFLFLLLFFLPGLTHSLIPLGSKLSGGGNSTWLSPSGAFAFGFLLDYQKDGGFLLAIFHNFPSSKTPVWSVGAGARVTQNSTFQLLVDGSFQLFDESPSKLPVWSTSTARSGVVAAKLLDNGNLVLVGSRGEFLWQSFDSPTDTLLPGQALRFPHSLRAPSVNSVASYYSFRILSSGELLLVWEDNVTYWSSHLNLNYSDNASLDVIEARIDADGLFGLFGNNGSATWFKRSDDYKDPVVKFRRLTIDSDGNLRMYSWDSESLSWKVGWQAVLNQCNVFGSCGLYSVCGYNSTGPVCDCLSESLISGQCAKMADLDNCQSRLSMSIHMQTVLYSLYPPHDVEVMRNSAACKEHCLNDSSCFAATALNDGSGRCTIKRSSFISGYHHSSVHATSFLKVCLVPEAVSAQIANFHGDALPSQQSPSLTTEHRNFTAAIALLLLITGFVFLTVEIFVFWIVLYRRKKISSRRGAPVQKDLRTNPQYNAAVRLSFAEVKALTRNFANKLAPNVYKGTLPNKVSVAVKILENVPVSERKFLTVVLSLGSTRHHNVIALKGFCYEPQHKLLLYEYISNQSLHMWLFNRRYAISERDSWNKRLNIAIGISRGLAHLHLECKQCIAHGDLKLENILLDENLVPKVTNFGLWSLMSSDTPSTSETLPERDIYMFGEMLLQIVSGKPDNVESGLRDMAYEMCNKGALNDFIDIQLEGKVDEEGVERVIRLALWCLQNHPALRPSIGEVVMVLEGALSLEMPPTPQALKFIQRVDS